MMDSETGISERLGSLPRECFPAEEKISREGRMRTPVTADGS